MAERDPRLSECSSCPRGAIECVHFGGLTLWLADNSTEGSPEFPGHYSSNVFTVMGPLRPHICTKIACPDHLVMNQEAANCVSYSALPEARTELARRAELLRLGEPARG